MKKTLNRYSCNFVAENYFGSEECKQICTTYSKIARTPKMILIEAHKNTGKEYIKQLMDDAGLQFPIMIKAVKTFNFKFTHK